MKTIGQYVEELICLEEVSEIPEIAAQIKALKEEIVAKFTKAEREAAWLTF